MAKGKKKLGVSIEDAQKTIMDFEDLLMKTVAHHGLTCNSVPEMLVSWSKLKQDLKWKVEEGVNVQDNTIMEAPQATNEYKRLDLASTKKYAF